MLRERQHRLLYLASAAQVGPRQFADLDAMLDECAEVLDAPDRPELFVSQSPTGERLHDRNGYTVHRRHLGMYDLMTHDEMRFVVGPRTRPCAVWSRGVPHDDDAPDAVGAVVRIHSARRLGASRHRRRSAGMAAKVGALRRPSRTAVCQDLDIAIRVEIEARRRKSPRQVGHTGLPGAGTRIRKVRRHARRCSQAAEPGTAEPSVLGPARGGIDQWVDTGGYGASAWPATTRHVSMTTTCAYAEDLGAAARHYKDGFDQSDDPLIRGIRDGLGGIFDVGRKLNEWRRGPKADDE